MPNNNFNPQRMQGLVNVISKKIGVPPEQLMNELQQGKFDSALKNMKPQEATMFGQFMSNPQMLDKLMSTPQAQSLYNKLSGDDNNKK